MSSLDYLELVLKQKQEEYDALMAKAARVEELEAENERLRGVNDKVRSFDAMLLGDGGGGDVGWWHDYIRLLLDQADTFYRTEIEVELAERKEESDRD